jgi:hypothetical protein
MLMSDGPAPSDSRISARFRRSAFYSSNRAQKGNLEPGYFLIHQEVLSSFAFWNDVVYYCSFVFVFAVCIFGSAIIRAR